MLVFQLDLFEYLIGGLKLAFYFIDKGQIEKGVSKSYDFLWVPMHHSFCNGDALKIGAEEWIWSFHFFENEKNGQDIKIYIIVVLPLKAGVLIEKKSYFWLTDSLDAYNEVFRDWHDHFIARDMSLCWYSYVIGGRKVSRIYYIAELSSVFGEPCQKSLILI